MQLYDLTSVNGDKKVQFRMRAPLLIVLDWLAMKPQIASTFTRNAERSDRTLEYTSGQDWPGITFFIQKAKQPLGCEMPH